MISWWPAPAKLNLFLHVTGRRDDGFHDLQTVFQLLDWGDRVGLETTDSGEICRISGPESINAETDLSVRAARALRDRCPGSTGARIHLEKHIPTGAGLGGGSSDAATVLLALNRLWGAGLGAAELAEIGARLGSDVPVFVFGSSAWAQGRGDQLEPVELPERWYVVLYPGVGVGTAEIFQAPELTRNSPLITIRALFDGGTRNDFEPVVCARYPEVAAALEWLGKFAPARLTGSGSCVFAAFADAAHAERVAARVPDVWRSFVARGVNRSPLHQML